VVLPHPLLFVLLSSCLISKCDRLKTIRHALLGEFLNINNSPRLLFPHFSLLIVLNAEHGNIGILGDFANKIV